MRLSGVLKLLPAIWRYELTTRRSFSRNIFNGFIRHVDTYLNAYNRGKLFVASRHIQLSSKVFSQELRVVDFQQVKSSTSDSDSLIIDVREPDELEKTGIIPGSINIPLGNVEDALKLGEEEFNARYGCKKPSINNYAKVIFSCQLGVRSANATAIAQKLGISNSYNYLGGWADWEEKIKQ